MSLLVVLFDLLRNEIDVARERNRLFVNRESRLLVAAFFVEGLGPVSGEGDQSILRVDGPKTLEHACLFAAWIKLVERQISILVDVAAHVYAGPNLLIKIAPSELVAGAHQFHLQIERGAD